MSRIGSALLLKMTNFSEKRSALFQGHQFVFLILDSPPLRFPVSPKLRFNF